MALLKVRRDVEVIDVVEFVRLFGLIRDFKRVTGSALCRWNFSCPDKIVIEELLATSFPKRLFTVFHKPKISRDYIIREFVPNKRRYKNET